MRDSRPAQSTLLLRSLTTYPPALAELSAGRPLTTSDLEGNNIPPTLSLYIRSEFCGSARDATSHCWSVGCPRWGYRRGRRAQQQQGEHGGGPGRMKMCSR